MKTLGINTFLHDSSIALVDDHKIIAAVEEERFNRIKKTNKFPHQSISWLQKEYQKELSEVETIAVPWSKDKILENRAEFEFLLDYMMRLAYPETQIFQSKDDVSRDNLGLEPRVSSQLTKKVVDDFLNLDLYKALGCEDLKCAKIKYIPHNFAHATTGYYLSEYRKAIVLHLDAFGDDCSTSVFLGEGETLSLLSKKDFDKSFTSINSIGVLYSLITYILGFRPLYDEYKVMGLAAYGNDTKYYSELKSACCFDDEGYLDCNIKILLDKIKNNIIPLRRSQSMDACYIDVAYGLQKLTEEYILNICKHWSERYHTKNICLTGGVALNCVVAGKLVEEGYNLFVPPIADDTGIALGAALAANHLHNDTVIRNHIKIEDSFYGPSYDDNDVVHELNKRNLKYECMEDPFTDSAKEIASGKIIGWFDGASEIGPRALGNRSIFADPRKKYMKRKLNQIIKEREDFRPFAIAMLEEEMPKYYNTSQLSPFMNIVFSSNNIAIDHLPAAVHVDGTTRIQTVNCSNNSLYKILQAFYRMTGVPAIINTSFNQKEPIVLTPQHAVDCFLRCNMDYLYFGHYKVSREVEHEI